MLFFSEEKEIGFQHKCDITIKKPLHPSVYVAYVIVAVLLYFFYFIAIIVVRSGECHFYR